MNQQQKLHIRARLRQIAEDTIEEFAEIQTLDAEEKVELGLKEKYLRWPTLGEMKERILNRMGHQRYSRAALGEEIFGEVSWKTWEAELNRVHQAAEKRKKQARKALDRLTRETVDKVMLGEASESLTWIADFEAEAKKIVTDYNGVAIAVRSA